MRVALNIYVGTMLLVLLLGSIAITKRLDDIHATSRQVAHELKADRK